MNKSLPLTLIFLSLLFLSSCRPKNYTSSLFDQQTASHKVVAVLPAEMIFTGTQPKELTPADIAKIEEAESKLFQQYLYNSILRHANTRKYYTRVNFQDVSSTWQRLEENKISIRDSWKKDDRELATILGVDAVVRLRIQKQRYMSDLASYGIAIGRRIINATGAASGIPLPYMPNKTNDIYASCNLVSNNQALWNDHYKGGSDYNTPPDVVIENITDNFGERFPYKMRK